MTYIRLHLVLLGMSVAYDRNNDICHTAHTLNTIFPHKKMLVNSSDRYVSCHSHIPAIVLRFLRTPTTGSQVCAATT